MKVIIWGTGDLAKEILHNGINGEVLGFLETRRSKMEYEGYPVYDTDSIPEWFDYIIVANHFSSEIYEICLKLKIDISKIVFLKRGDNIAFNPDKRLRDVLWEVKRKKGYLIWGWKCWKSVLPAYEG